MINIYKFKYSNRLGIRTNKRRFKNWSSMGTDNFLKYLRENYKCSFIEVDRIYIECYGPKHDMRRLLDTEMDIDDEEKVTLITY